MKHYLIYKITNNLNGKFYIGKHVTENIDDGYMGSGTLIKRAIAKYGVENFTKEILFDVYGEDLMNFLEEAIVDEAFVKRKDTYNLKTGGDGGVPNEETRRKISETEKGKIPWNKGKTGYYITSEETRRKISKANRGQHRTKETRSKMSEVAKGKPKSEEHRRKLSEANKGKTYSDERKIKQSEAIKKWWMKRKAEVNIC